ncbi:MAG: HNH endonuclease [Elusimicrobia bacterium]|nr:HNH endonuclease [Candidatus Obscuribacterium magneticum]
MIEASTIDAKIRLMVFNWLEEQCRIYGETLPRKLFEKGVPVESGFIPLVGPQGIFKPKVLPEIPLSITTSPESPYKDEYSRDNYLHYKYRGTDPEHRDNRGLRSAMINHIPLVYLFGVVPGKYLPVWPVYIIGDDPAKLTFRVAVDENEKQLVGASTSKYQARENVEEDGRRRYLTVQTRHRLHQQRFRERVLQAYREQCAMCRLRRPELLEAIHIIPDSDPDGEPVISNGIALCNLHHAAFDRYILGIRPNYEIEVRQDILNEVDGPVLQHGLKNLNNQKLLLPHSNAYYPDPARLEIRYQQFKVFSV